MEGVNLDLLAICMSAVALIVSVVVAVLTWQKRSEDLQRAKAQDRQAKAQERQCRIRAIVNKYMDLALAHKDSGFSALLASGVKDLRDHGEIQEAVDAIAQRTTHPLGSRADRFYEIDLKAFFDELNIRAPGPVNYDDLLKKFGLQDQHGRWIERDQGPAPALDGSCGGFCVGLG